MIQLLGEEILETIMQVTLFSGWLVGAEAIRVAKISLPQKSSAYFKPSVKSVDN
ncbi:hypothetical protein ACFLXD_06320 [Chloroflexota bacterium]